MDNQQPNFTVECEITVVKKVRKKKADDKVKIGRLPRVSKLMALAIHFQQLVNDGKVKREETIYGLVIYKFMNESSEIFFNSKRRLIKLPL